MIEIGRPGPPLKWAGGKRWLVPRLQLVWKHHAHRRLVEPFVGGMAVALGLQPERALLNDVNAHLINFYRHLQHGLVAELNFLNESDAFYSARTQFNALITRGGAWTQEAAELFYYLNRTGYNGLCRFNSRGEFNVPFGRYKNINYTTDFRAYASTLRNWTFTAGDFEDIEVLDTDFVYADPPYDVGFTSYSKDGFDFEDQVRHAEWLAGLSVPVVASNQATPRIQALYSRLGFDMEEILAPRRISSDGDRAPVREALFLKGV